MQYPARFLAFVVVLCLLSGCSSSDDATNEETMAAPTTSTTTTAASTTEAATSTTAAPSTTATAAVTTVSVEPLVEVEVVLWQVYHSGDDRFVGGDSKLHVVVPTSDGPWPIVVVLHGNPSTSSNEWSMPIARAIGEQGRVVFVPNWGHTSTEWQSEGTWGEEGDLVVAEVLCAVAFAKATATDYGGDPDHVTVMGYSAGGNAALMAAMSDLDPLDACVVPGPGVEPQAVVILEADALLSSPVFDPAFADDPETFYAFTPWRNLDPDDPFPIRVLAADTRDVSAERSVEDDRSWVDLRHVDITLEAALDAMGVFDDGVFTFLEGNEWTYQTLVDAGYDTTWVLLPDSRHTAMSPHAWQLTIDTVLNAENG